MLLLCAGCGELGNPPQRVTPTQVWSEGRDEISTTSQSFADPETIARLVREGLGDLDFADPLVKTGETLTLVTVVPNLHSRRRSSPQQLSTLFEFASGRKIERRWVGRPRQQTWRAAFALPEPPTSAITALARADRQPSP